MLYLVLALVWLVLGASLLVLHATTPDYQDWKYRFILVFALMMTVWNLLRWFFIRQKRLRRARTVQAEARSPRGPRGERLGEPDPTFDFTHDPPPVRRADGSEDG